MLTKYGTYVIFRCKKCKHEVKVPLHQKDAPQLEKYASYCTHEWEEVDGEFENNESINSEKS